MRALPVALLAAAAIAASPSPAQATSCPVEIEWRGDTYSGTGALRAVRGRLLGTGVMSVCDDEDRVRVHAVRGVEPRFSISAAADERGVFLNTAYPVRLPEHPLHRLVYGHRRWPACRPVRRVTAIGEFESLRDVLRVDAGRGPDAFFVDDRTRMEPRFGRLGVGDRIRVDGSACRFEGGAPIPFARTVMILERARPERADAGAIDPDVVVGAIITAAIFVLGFGVRALRARR
jgi:hypothetical protein